MAAPAKVLIPHEPKLDERFHYVGQFEDGRQFMAFGVGAFPGENHYAIPENWREVKRWIAVLHLFDADGNHIRTEARLVGFDQEGAAVYHKILLTLDNLLSEFGLEHAELGDIEVKPFSIEIDEIYYGLVYEQEVGEDGTEYESATLWPNNCMFYPPWNDGSYDT